VSAGEAFRREFEATYAEPELLYRTLLEQVVRALDLIEEMEARVAEDGLTVRGSAGQPRANPLLAEIRQQQTALARLLGALELDDPRADRRSARRAANARWSKP
jgi:hypothetical protein